MSKQETDKRGTEHKSQITLEDLSVGDAQRDEVKGVNRLGDPITYTYTVTNGSST